MSKPKEAVTSFLEGFNCSQSVFSAYAPQLGLEKENALRIASTFGGGIVRKGDTCGAVTGALMIIGLKFGNTNSADKEAKEQNYEIANAFIKRFSELHGSIKCRELLNCDMGTEEGLKEAHEKQLTRKLCPKFIEDASLIVEEIIK